LNHIDIVNIKVPRILHKTWQSNCQSWRRNHTSTTKSKENDFFVMRYKSYGIQEILFYSTFFFNVGAVSNHTRNTYISCMSILSNISLTWCL